MGRQTVVIEAQCRLIYRMEEEFNRKLARLERMMDPVGSVMVVDHVHWGAPTKGSSGLVDTQG